MPSITHPGGLAATACTAAIAAAVTLTTLSAPALANNASDRTIVPGVRVGAVYGLSTPAQLRRVYGRNIVFRRLPAGEGTFEDGAIVFPGTRSEIRVFFRDGRRGVRSVDVPQRGAAWSARSRGGRILIGANILRIRDVNGRHFRLERENDGHNCTSQWRGGRISKNLLLCFREARRLSQAQSNRISRHRGMHTQMRIVGQVFVLKSMRVFLNKTRPPKRAAGAQRPVGAKALTAAQRRCALRQNLFSPKGGAAANVTFVNRSGAYRSIMWLDFKGRPKSYANLNNGQRFTVKTNSRHPWMITDGPGNCLEIHIPGRGQRVIVLRPDRRSFGPE